MAAITEGSNEELSIENRKAVEEELQDELETNGVSPQNILVRGALLQCSCGSHCRRLNLPKSYGEYEEDLRHPIVLEKDCIVGDEQNIAYFGICNGDNKPDSETICLKPYVWPDGTETGDENVTGKKCEPIILDSWFRTQEDNQYVDPESSTTKYNALKGDSFLICKYGGVIQAKSSGQELEGDDTECQY